MKLLHQDLLQRNENNILLILCLVKTDMKHIIWHTNLSVTITVIWHLCNMTLKKDTSIIYESNNS